MKGFLIVLKSFCSAFLMYSKIPVPNVEWNEENRRYSLCFFPLVGLATGAVLILWKAFCERMYVGDSLSAAVSCVIPLIVCGGIHLDGFCDVIDAYSSHASRERKLEIMSDSHIGAFAVIGVICYFLIQFGLFAEINYTGTAVAVLGFPLSRALSGIAAVTFKSAKSEGSLQSFSKPAHKSVTITVLVLYVLVIAILMAAADLVCGIASVIAAGGAFLFYRVFAYKHFGGITGDLAGFFLQICELAVLAAAVFGENIALLI